MSTQGQAQTQQSEVKKSSFDQTFLCPKCSEILFTKIFYFENTNTPQVKFTCPKKHSGMVDLSLFFDLFYSSNQEIENELSKFEEELERDIENYRNRKLLERKKAEEEETQKISKTKDIESNNENENKTTNENNNENESKSANENSIAEANTEINTKSFKELERCNIIEFTLFNYKKNETNKNNNINISNINSNNNINYNSNINNINKNIINKKSKEKRAISHKVSNNINTIKKLHSLEKEEKIKDEKFLCELHNKSHFIGYCLSCKKNICKKCLKSKKHKTKMFKHMIINEKSLNELNKLVGQCQETLNKLEKKCKILIDSLSLNNIEEKKEKTLLYIMSNNLIEINKEYLNEVKTIIKNYNNCLKNKMLNYEIIISIKNIKIKNNIKIPNDIQELLAIIKDYKEYLFEKSFSSENSNNNKYLLFDTFNEIIKNGLSNPDNEKCEIKFSDIIENEKFRSLINLNDFKTEDLSDKNDEEEKEIHEVEKIEYGTNDYEDGEDIDRSLDEEEEENECPEFDEEENEEYEEDEDENNHGDDEEDK